MVAVFSLAVTAAVANRPCYGRLTDSDSAHGSAGFFAMAALRRSRD
jgi:hypothetical protein